MPLLGGALALAPLAVVAQSQPIVGFLSSRVRQQRIVDALWQGLGDEGFAQGRNGAFESRFAEGRFERLPALLGELMQRGVAVIVTQGTPAAIAAKTAMVPVVFVAGFDPVRAGLVASLNRPGGNMTGVTLVLHLLAAKRLELLLEIVPPVVSVAALLNPTSPNADPEFREMHSVAQPRARTLHRVDASTPDAIRAGFAAMTARRVGGVVVGSDPFLADQGTLIAAEAARLMIPAIYPFRDHAEAGGLISLGSSLRTAYRQAGGLAGRILKGSRPADLPILQPATFEIVVNTKTAAALGIKIPESIILRADEVIE